ncbi:ABC transporter ATP-binding protein [Pelosinus propionicus]|uniref:Iron complex transport system ATP-binding protein n=1 Tax=Pelosinus propionicus DSM 13327 TaxID=1123291 RepID=A0A1I4N5H7_9FIRM|nr:ABC transporter ATP-binding protein [Pelosinus propionicus]SFM10782.1 iron complex transport system ATP-binding protein [Pelosinus propionicus DSM 13327]
MSNMKAEALSVNFDDKMVLKDLSLAIEEGKIISILGPNGSGKSTLLNVLSRNIKPNKGIVYLDGQNLSQLSGKMLAQQMAVLPQSPQAPSDLTVRDLVEFGRFPHQSWWRGKSEQDEACVSWALMQTGLIQMADRVVSTLSGGERQRVWIAMALAQKPEILLLDEPTTYLDICHQLEIMELLAAFNHEHKLTVVMVLHDINHAAKYSDYVAVLQQGQIFAAGEPAEVITEHTLREVFRVESEISFDVSGKPMVMIRGLTPKN